MIKHLVVVIIAIIPCISSACETEENMRKDALRTLYADQDVTRYVCIESAECNFEEFSKQLEIKQISLGIASKRSSAAIQIEPVRKGHQYFSAVFLLDQCKYHMVFAPDTTFSDVKFIKKTKNNFFVLRAVERDSAESWKEYDFSYDSLVRKYNLMATHCFRMSEEKTLSVKCD